MSVLIEVTSVPSDATILQDHSAVSAHMAMSWLQMVNIVAMSTSARQRPTFANINART